MQSNIPASEIEICASKYYCKKCSSSAWNAKNTKFILRSNYRREMKRPKYSNWKSKSNKALMRFTASDNSFDLFCFPL